jgi:hypothetical protein
VAFDEVGRVSHQPLASLARARTLFELLHFQSHPASRWHKSGTRPSLTFPKEWTINLAVWRGVEDEPIEHELTQINTRPFSEVNNIP